MGMVELHADLLTILRCTADERFHGTLSVQDFCRWVSARKARVFLWFALTRWCDRYHVGWVAEAGSDFDFYNTKHEIVHSEEKKVRKT
jgi:hypothetical protein